MIAVKEIDIDNALATVAEAILGFRAGYRVEYTGPRPHARQPSEKIVSFRVYPEVFDGEEPWEIPPVREDRWLAAIQSIRAAR